MTHQDPDGTVGPLTVGHLTRELTARAGQPAPTLRVYESLAALWIRRCDIGRPGAGQLRESTWRAARLLLAGEDTVMAPQQRSIPNHLARDESLVRAPASWAVQRAVAGWVPPGIFGDAARTAAAVRHPVVPATLAVAPGPSC